MRLRMMSRRLRSLLIGLVVLPMSVGATLSTSVDSSAQADGFQISFSTEVSGVAAPTHMAEAPDGSGRMFITSKHGKIFVSDADGLQPEPFLDISDLVNDEFDESGLFSIAFHPEFAANGFFFVAFTGYDQTNHVMRFRALEAEAGRADPASGRTILAIPDGAPAYHNGGGLAFGPDGYLYYSMGDDATEGNARNLLDLRGKILRIDPSTGAIDEGEPAYEIPPDNPFVDRDDALPEIWAYGLRNPWRFSFDRGTGDLYIADVGQADWEEINLQPADSPGGENYGWPAMEGSHCFRPAEGCDQSGLTLPVYEYSHDEGCAVIGGNVYRGALSPSLAGKYLFADICSGSIWSLLRDEDGAWNRELLATTELTIASFAEDASGEIYITTFDNGAVRRIVEANPEPLDSSYFAATWERSDGPVASGAASRTWIWGPWESRDVRVERYDDAPNGRRTVVYLDKARMEITYPDGDTSSTWYVTNGLLVNELITGKLQVGDELYQQREPAEINVAGDWTDSAGPTYASFAKVLDFPPLPFDRPIIQRLNRDGTAVNDDSLSAYGVEVEWIDTVTTHSIAGPFWEFMNSDGPIVVDGELQQGSLFPNPFFATGRPVTEAYWAEVVVAGTAKDVLIQCFERRCLTYTPDNPDGWRVEAGNVGQHYREWRYGS